MPMFHIYQKECSQGWETFTFCICTSYCIKQICTMNISVYLHNWQCVSLGSNFNLLHVLAMMWGSVTLVICVDPTQGETILRGKEQQKRPSSSSVNLSNEAHSAQETFNDWMSMFQFLLGCAAGIKRRKAEFEDG